MQIWFICSLVFALIVALFAVLNSDVVTINLLWTKYELSQSIVILLSAVFGAIVASFIGVFSKIKSSLKIRELKHTIKQLENKAAEREKEENISIETTFNEMGDEEIKLEEEKKG